MPRTRLTLMSLAALASLLVAAPTQAAAQEGVVGGVVADGETLRPLTGAQVSVVDTEIGALTDGEGRFRLEGLSGATVELRVEMLGYRTETVTAEVGDLELEVALRPTAIQLDAMVVTGTAGAQEQRSLGNVVSRIDASRLTELAPIQDVATMLNARAPGVSVQFGSGMVGSGPRIRIRGAASFSLDDQPLVYVDGVRVDNRVSSGPTVQGFGGAVISRLNDINPEDIESMEIIKGPAAATLYGTEASNGVIQIITRRGQAGERPRFGISVRQGATWFGNPQGRIQPNYFQNPETGEVEPFDLVRREQDRGTPIFTTGHLQGYTADLTGGGDAFRYYASAGFDRDQGIEPTNRMERFTGRVNLGILPREDLDINLNVGVTTGTTHLARENGGIWFGTLFSQPHTRDTPQRGFWTAPPEAIWRAFEDFQTLRRYTGGLQVEHQPLDWLTQRLSVGLDAVGEDNQQITPFMDDELRQFYSGATVLGSKSVDRLDRTQTTLDYGATASASLRDGIISSTSLGFQYYRTHTRQAGATGQQFPAPGLTTIDAAAQTFGSDTFWENTTVGMYLQQQFAWEGRRFITVAVRADDNSAFGEDFSFVTYPKVSGSWVLSEEPFWNVPVIQDFRLRAAFGATGQQPETFAALRTFEPITSGRGTAAVTPGAFGNPELAPERGEELEFGFETSLLQDRVAVDVTFYNTRTRDALLQRGLAPSSGFSGSQWVNVGEIRNRGLEVQVSGSPWVSPSSQLEITANVSTNSNRIVDLGELAGHVSFREGDPVGAFYDRRIVEAELDEDGVAHGIRCDGGPEVGHQPVPCDEAPEVMIARSQPTMEGSLGSTLTLGPLQFFTLFDGSYGHSKSDLTLSARCSIINMCRENFFPQEFDPVWIANIQEQHIDWRTSDASFIRFREASVSYTLPDDWAGRMRASRATLSLGARNLALWTSYTGLDPEAFRMNQLHSRGDQEQMPQLAQFVSTLRLTF